MKATGAKGKKISNTSKDELLEAAKETDAIRSRHARDEGWNSADEIRKWRETRRPR